MEKKTIFETIGNIELLSHRRIVIFCSQAFNSALAASAVKLLLSLSSLPLVFCGGWQAPFEKKIYELFSRSSHSIQFIHYLARDINTYKTSESEQWLLEQERLLIIAPKLSASRANVKFVTLRDRLIFEQNNKILFLGISKQGRLAQYLAQLSSAQYQLFILDHPANKQWFGEDVLALGPENADIILQI